jgi:hypothetical protein
MNETTTLIITTSVTIALAIIGYLATYINNLILNQRKEKLDRLNRQLSELYGPMFGITHASDIAWQQFKKKYRFGSEFFDRKKRLSSKDFKAFRIWMTTVFMPMNKQLFDVILAKSDLLIEAEMPESMLLFCAHIAAYDAVLERWKEKDYSEIQSVIHYPGKINEYARSSFVHLKAQQDKLLGKSKFFWF